MPVLLLSLLIYAAVIPGIIFGVIRMEQGKSPVLFIVSLVIALTAWLLWCGLIIIRPQEAIVLTLFGKYIGTLKEPGYYFVNPFCSSLTKAAT